MLFERKNNLILKIELFKKYREQDNNFLEQN